MRTIKALLCGCFAVLLFFASCNYGNSPDIEGSYTSYQSGEYSISKDTLVIVRYGGKGDYQVVRRSGFQRVRDGKLMPMEHRVQDFIGRFDPETGTLTIASDGKKISFLPEGRSLLLMQREYHKMVGQ
ncbi:hypothetical protein [Pedobacter sp.]